MNYIYDLMLNFSDYNNCFEFYEWVKSDNIINIQKMPIIRINRLQMNDVLNNRIKITTELLNKIKNKTLAENGELLRYAFLVTDLSKVLALEFNENGEIIKSSSLLLDEEEAVVHECLEYSEESIEYVVISHYKKYDFLTRQERKIRDNLLLELKTLYNNKAYDEIRYLYEELYNDNVSVHDEYNFLMNDIKNNFNSKYHKLYDIITLT